MSIAVALIFFYYKKLHGTWGLEDADFSLCPFRFAGSNPWAFKIANERNKLFCGLSEKKSERKSPDLA